VQNKNEDNKEVYAVTEKHVNGMPKFQYCLIGDVKPNQRIIEMHDNISDAALGAFRCYNLYCRSLEVPKVYAVYLEDTSSLGMYYTFGNIISLHDAQTDKYYKTRKIVFISDNWKICNELCQEIGDIENARFARLNGITSMWDSE